MDAILKFDLDDADDRNAHRRCISATEAYMALHDISERLRVLDKAGAMLSPESVRKDFYDIMEQYSVDLDHLE